MNAKITAILPSPAAFARIGDFFTSSRQPNVQHLLGYIEDLTLGVMVDLPARQRTRIKTELQLICDRTPASTIAGVLDTLSSSVYPSVRQFAVLARSTMPAADLERSVSMFDERQISVAAEGVISIAREITFPLKAALVSVFALWALFCGGPVVRALAAPGDGHAFATGLVQAVRESFGRWLWLWNHGTLLVLFASIVLMVVGVFLNCSRRSW